MRSAFGTGIAAAVMVMAVSPAWALGPSFDCAKALTPGAQLICSSPDLSATDLAYAQAYYALRQQVGESGAQALKLEAIAFESRAFQRCDVPSTGALPADKDAMIACVSQAYQRQRGVWMSRLTGPATDEATRPLQQHTELQKDLQELGFLPASAVMDGVYGAGTRAAIVAWQQSQHRYPTGLLSDADATAIRQEARQGAIETEIGVSGGAGESWQGPVTQQNEPDSAIRVSADKGARQLAQSALGGDDQALSKLKAEVAQKTLSAEYGLGYYLQQRFLASHPHRWDVLTDYAGRLDPQLQAMLDEQQRTLDQVPAGKADAGNRDTYWQMIHLWQDAARASDPAAEDALGKDYFFEVLQFRMMGTSKNPLFRRDMTSVEWMVWF